MFRSSHYDEQGEESTGQSFEQYLSIAKEALTTSAWDGDEGALTSVEGAIISLVAVVLRRGMSGVRTPQALDVDRDSCIRMAQTQMSALFANITVAGCFKQQWRNTCAIEEFHAGRSLPEEVRCCCRLTPVELEKLQVVVSSRLAFLLAYWHFKGFTDIYLIDFSYWTAWPKYDLIDIIPTRDISEVMDGRAQQPRLDLLTARARAYDQKVTNSAVGPVEGVTRYALQAWRIMGRCFFGDTTVLGRLASLERPPLPEKYCASEWSRYDDAEMRSMHIESQSKLSEVLRQLEGSADWFQFKDFGGGLGEVVNEDEAEESDEDVEGSSELFEESDEEDEGTDEEVEGSDNGPNAKEARAK